MVEDNDLISRSELLKHKVLLHGTDWTDDDFLADAVLVEDIIKAPAVHRREYETEGGKNETV